MIDKYQQDRNLRAQYLNDMRKQHRAIRDVFGSIVEWQHKANGYKFRQSPPPF